MGDKVRLFNAKDGEWLAEILPGKPTRRGEIFLAVIEPSRLARPLRPLTLFFAPVQKNRNEAIVEKRWSWV